MYTYVYLYLFFCIYIYKQCIYIYTSFSYCRTPQLTTTKGFLLLSVGSWNNKSFGCKSPWIHPSWWTWWVGASWANKNWTWGMGENYAKIAPPILVVNLLKIEDVGWFFFQSAQLQTHKLKKFSSHGGNFRIPCQSVSAPTGVWEKR